MKKISKLQLNKETIASLSKLEQSSILGGEEFFSLFTCREEVSKCKKCEPVPINSTPQNPQTCVGETCLYLNGC